MANYKRLFVIGMDGMNYPLLKRFMKENKLPTFSRLLARGSLNRLLPTIPAWTPTNWASAVTGASSGTTQLGGWVMRHKDDEWTKPNTMSWDHQILEGAETLWEVADESSRRTLITHYPSASWNVPLKHGIVVAPGIHDAPFSYAGGMSYYLIARKGVESRVETPGEDAKARSTDVEEVGAPPGSSVVGLMPAATIGWKNVEKDELGCELPVVMARGNGAGRLFLLVKRAPTGGLHNIRICHQADADTVLTAVPDCGWSSRGRDACRQAPPAQIRT